MTILYKPKGPHYCDLIDPDALPAGTIDKCDDCGRYRKVFAGASSNWWELIDKDVACAIIESQPRPDRTPAWAKPLLRDDNASVKSVERPVCAFCGAKNTNLIRMERIPEWHCESGCK